jgi:hypothetical protein
MNVQNINSAVHTFFIDGGELPAKGCNISSEYEVLRRTLSGESNFKLFDEIIFDFVKAFGPVMGSLIDNIDQLQDNDRVNCERAIKALWNGDSDTQHRVTKLVKKKVSKKPSTNSKTRKTCDPKKFFKTIRPALKKAIKESKKKKNNSPMNIFKKKVSPELKKAVKQKKNVKTQKKRTLRLLVKTMKEKVANAKNAQKETKQQNRKEQDYDESGKHP